MPAARDGGGNRKGWMGSRRAQACAQCLELAGKCCQLGQRALAALQHTGRNAFGGIAVRLAISLPGMDRSAAQALVDAAHQVCPYSNATRGNIDVALTLV